MRIDNYLNPNRYIYDTKYSDEHLTLKREGMPRYDREMIEIRLELLRKYGTRKCVLDLCCGTGSYLLYQWGIFDKAIGIDFSSNLLKIFFKKLNGNKPENLWLLECDARQVALRSKSVDFVFSYTSLYHVPHLEIAITEVSRVLKSGGMAVFELGNLWSLNTYVCERAHRRDGIAKPFHIPYPSMLRIIRDAKLTIIEQRAFQILPMWGQSPIWLRPLANWHWWKKILGIKVGGRMIDEQISSLWPLRLFAFRHLFICRKD